MKRFSIHALAAISGFVCLVSCSDQESNLPSLNPSPDNQLRIATHTREGEVPVSSAASVYIFNDNNAFVNILQTDAGGDYVSAKLPEDTYTLYAYGGDLSHFQFPDDASTTPSSVITLADNQTMGDLLMATSTVTLPDGTDEVVDLTLQRKVLELTSVTISQVPADVTGVTVSIAPFYSAIQVNGTYVDSDPVTCTIPLAATSDAGVWQTTSEQLVFPSQGIPVITVTFTRGESDASTYTFSELTAALTANNKYDIAGTYTEPLGVTLSGAITLQPWSTTPTDVTFEFDESNAGNGSTNDPSSGTDDPNPGSGGSETSDAPVAGQLYKGCYVVSVNSDAKTAVLLSPTEKKCSTITTNTPYDWPAFIDNQLSSWPSVASVSGVWRLPTISEANAFENIPNAFEMAVNKSNKYQYKDGDHIGNFQILRTSTDAVDVRDFTDNLSLLDYLRPVIDIFY